MHASCALELTARLVFFDAGGGAQSADALKAVRDAFEAQGKTKVKKPAMKRQAAGKTWCVHTLAAVQGTRAILDV